MVDRFGTECSLSEDHLVTLNLILDEMVSNVIKYGYDDDQKHQIKVEVVVEPSLMTIEVQDDGKAFNPLEAPLPDFDIPLEQRRIGGLGVYIVKAMCDEVVYKRENERNILTMRKKLE